jgi:hypothetical protein
LRDAKAGEIIAVPVNPQELILPHETRDAERHLRSLKGDIEESQEELGRLREERGVLEKEAEERVREETMRRAESEWKAKMAEVV